MNMNPFVIEVIGWFSTATFLISIVLPQRSKLHEWGMITAITTGIYGLISVDGGMLGVKV